MTINHSEKDYQELQKTNWKNINFLNGKIEQLEKENEDLELQRDGQSITIKQQAEIIKKLKGQVEYWKASEILIREDRADWITKTEELKQIIDTAPSNINNDNMRLRKNNAFLKKKIDNMLNQDFELARLKKENEELQATINRMDNACEEDRQIIINLTDERDALKPKLKNQPKLNREEVEKIFIKCSYVDAVREYFDDIKFIDKILALAIPEIDKEKIVEKLESYQKAYGKCFDLLEYEDLEKLALEIIKEMRE